MTSLLRGTVTVLGLVAIGEGEQEKQAICEQEARVSYPLSYVKLGRLLANTGTCFSASHRVYSPHVLAQQRASDTEVILNHVSPPEPSADCFVDEARSPTTTCAAAFVQ